MNATECRSIRHGRGIERKRESVDVGSSRVRALMFFGSLKLHVIYSCSNRNQRSLRHCVTFSDLLASLNVENKSNLSVWLKTLLKHHLGHVNK